ncbi:MAG: hypothetical protein KatS3mg131_2117 [Candidatus Tectimicrobiota bacterium]|nr:MAG: hypothetical protein KatS3mg131_2117 [Candidatus Tectomicrobia bacterium]
MEFLINKDRWDALPEDLKAVVRYASMAAALEFTLKIRDLNSSDLKKIVEEKKVQVIETPREILVEVLKAWDKVAARHAQANPFFKKVLESQRAWAERLVPYRRVADPPYDLAADYYWGEINPYKVRKP